MIALYLAFLGIAAGFAVLQTNVLQIFSIAGLFPLPDLSFIVLVFMAFNHGAMAGQLFGFGSGVVLDCLSSSPFGFNAFVRTLSGHIIGRFKGVILLDSLLLPMVVVTGALLVKSLVVIASAVLIGQLGIIQRVFSLDALFELLLTIVFTPLLFWPLRIIDNLIMQRKAYR